MVRITTREVSQCLFRCWLKNIFLLALGSVSRYIGSLAKWSWSSYPFWVWCYGPRERRGSTSFVNILKGRDGYSVIQGTHRNSFSKFGRTSILILKTVYTQHLSRDLSLVGTFLRMNLNKGHKKRISDSLALYVTNYHMSDKIISAIDKFSSDCIFWRD